MAVQRNVVHDEDVLQQQDVSRRLSGERGKFQPQEVRFTKVLTKYSTEYNNQLFIYNMCQELDMDKKDMIAFFQELRLIYGSDFLSNPEIVQIVEEMFENYNINKLDIKRIYRYLDKNVKKETEEVDFVEDEGEL